MTFGSLSLFNFDVLAQVMTALIVFISINIAFFSWRYMRGDRQFNRFFVTVFLMTVSLITMVAADHIVLFLMAWALSNTMIVKLMIHNPLWQAAKNSGVLARNNFIFGFSFLSLAAVLLVWQTGSFSIQEIITNSAGSMEVHIALILIIMAAMAQSALWPFHKWLLSSLNAPTPVSAIMHAGLVNGGGFLIVRFSPLLVQENNFLLFLVAVGLLSAILGTLLKLVQTDVKRMLASSTMGQMGFMFVQLGLGLFSAAVCHLIWHGMFKAYLFLSSGGVVQEKSRDLPVSPTIASFASSVVCGFMGSYVFALSVGKEWLIGDTTAFLYLVMFIISAQCSLAILRQNPVRHFPVAFIMTNVLAAIYGYNVYLIEHILSPMGLVQPQHIGLPHAIIALLILGSWIVNLFPGVLHKIIGTEKRERLYVMALNMGLPHRKTVTANRNDYKY